jgi:hypothetical protein
MSGIANAFLGINVNTIMTVNGKRFQDLDTGQYVSKQTLIKKIVEKSDKISVGQQSTVTEMINLIEN